MFSDLEKYVFLCGKYCKFSGFCVFCCFLSLCSLRPHFGPILALFWGPKSLKSALGRGSEIWWIFDYFFFTILAILGSLGGSQGAPRGHHFRVIFALLGVWEANLLLHAPSGASLGDFWRFGLFSGVFFDDFSVFFWYALWYFFPMILTLIRATEEKLIDR